jgi:hypothetical protein
MHCCTLYTTPACLPACLRCPLLTSVHCSLLLLALLLLLLQYLVIRNVMDADWLAAANAVIAPAPEPTSTPTPSTVDVGGGAESASSSASSSSSAAGHASAPPAPPVERFEIPMDEIIQTTTPPSDCSPTIAAINATRETRIRSPYELPGGLGDPLRKMIDCDAVNQVRRAKTNERKEKAMPTSLVLGSQLPCVICKDRLGTDANKKEFTRQLKRWLSFVSRARTCTQSCSVSVGSSGPASQ